MPLTVALLAELVALELMAFGTLPFLLPLLPVASGVPLGLADFVILGAIGAVPT